MVDIWICEVCYYFWLNDDVIIVCGDGFGNIFLKECVFGFYFV